MVGFRHGLNLLSTTEREREREEFRFGIGSFKCRNRERERERETWKIMPGAFDEYSNRGKIKLFQDFLYLRSLSNFLTLFFL